MKRFLAAVMILSLIVIACFEAPLGDPLTSKVDHRLDGVWIQAQPDGKEYGAWLAAPLDEHVYCVEIATVTVVNGVVKSERPSGVFRAWMTPIAGSQFISIEPVAHLVSNNKVKKPYFSAQLTFADDGSLLVRGLDNDFKGIGDLTDPKALAKIVEQNIADPRLFGPTQTFRRPKSDDKSENAIESCFMQH
jgi:hypothetical protein